MLIGFIGRARNGKTTAAEAVAARCRERRLTCAIYDIGEIVRQRAVKVGVLPDKARESLNPTELSDLISFGAPGRRDGVWLGELELRLERERPQVALVPNIRFRDELHWCRSRAGIIVLIHRRNPDGSPYISPDRDPNDPSESSLWNTVPDFILDNVDPRLLQRQAATLFDYLQERGRLGCKESTQIPRKAGGIGVTPGG